MRIVVTAGPTREYLDDVRFISNPSSGRMGYAVAAEAMRRGHSVRLLSGPVCLEAPPGAEVRAFESVDELHELVAEALGEADCLVMAAAVGDYRPERRVRGKHKKGASWTLRLVATPDVARSVAAFKGERIFVGFAVETGDGAANARAKMEAKSFDMVVLNGPESFGADRAEFRLLFGEGRSVSLGRAAKSAVAVAILDEVEALFGGSKSA